MVVRAVVVRAVVQRAVVQRAVVLRAVSVAGALAVAMALTAGFAPAAVAAPVDAAPARAVATLTRAPKVPGPTAVQITGRFPGGKVVIRAQEDPARFRRLLDEVSWLAGATPQTIAPRVNKLGPKFTLVVLAKDGPQYTYDVYPQAAGGPRAYRPAKQPRDRKVKAGWFYGQLTMSETLRVSGVPVAETGKTVSGGIGGGERVNRGPELDPAGNVTDLMTDMRRLVLLNGAVVLTIALGLALISFLIRRKI